MEVLKQVYGEIWHERLWLPPNTTWEDVAPNSTNGLPEFDDLKTYPFLMAFSLIFLRYVIMNKLVFSPLFNYLGYKEVKPKKVAPHPDLENVYKTLGKNIPEQLARELADQIKWSERKVQRWFRVRQLMDKTTVHSKLCECSWACTYHCVAVFIGFIVLWDKVWLTDIRTIFDGYPYTRMSNDVWWYYMFTLGYYYSVTFTQFFDRKRDDFYQMFIHHIVTICLISFSYFCNFFRVGTLVMLLHAIADIPLMLAKTLSYIKWNKSRDIVFGFFTIVWVLTRCIIYPFYLCFNILFLFPKSSPLYYVIGGLLYALVILHYFWTYKIFRTFYRFICDYSKFKDSRSSSDDEELSNETNEGNCNNVLKKE